MRTLGALLLAVIALPAFAGLIVGPERAVAPPAYGPSYGTQYPVTVVSDGKDFLALWNEGGYPGRRGIFATQLSETLAVRSVPARAIAAGEFSAGPAVWAGDAYLVAFVAPQGHTFVARVSADGVVLEEWKIVGWQKSPRAMAWNGRHALLVLDRTAMLLDNHGRIVRDGISIPHRDNIAALDVAASNGSFVIAWADAKYSEFSQVQSIRTMRVSAEGEVDAPRDVATGVTGFIRQLRLAGSDSEIGLAYMPDRTSANSRARLTMHTIDARTGEAGAAVEALVPAWQLEVVSTSRGFVAGLLTGDEKSLAILPVAFSGEASPPIPIAPTPGSDLRLASNGSAVVAIWRDNRLAAPGEAHLQIFGAALDSAATRLTSSVEQVATSAIAQANPVIAPAGNEALVVWSDLSRTYTGELVAARVDAAGNRLGDPIVVSSENGRLGMSAATFTGRVWLVAWTVVHWTGETHRSTVMLARVARDGTLLEAPVELGDGNDVVLASTSAVTVLAFGPSLLRFSPEGERLDAEPIAVAPGFYRSLGTNGTEFLFAMTTGDDYWQWPGPTRYDVEAIRLDATGRPIDTTSIVIAKSGNSEFLPRVVSDGTDFLVVYVHASDSAPYTIRAKRVLRSGVLDGTTPTQDGALIAEGMYPFDAAAHDRGFVVAFADERQREVHAVTLDREGRPESQPRKVSVADFESGGVAVASSGPAVWLAYPRPSAELDNIPRVFVRRLFESMRRRAVR